MNQYQDLSLEIKKIQNPIKFMIILGMGVNVLIVLISLWIHFNKEESLAFTSMEACMKGVETLMQNARDSELISKSVLEDIKKQNISFNMDRIHLVKYLDGLSCDVITKEMNGYASYLITLEKNLRFKHLFKIRDVKGQPLTSEYQR